MKIKRLLSLLIVFSMLACSVTAVFAEPTPLWTDGLTTQPDGYVEEDNTISVSTAEGLAWISVLASGLNNTTAIDFSGKTIKLTADIDLSGKNWIPIGTDTLTFAGNFDGNFHSISNMNIADGGNYLGLFANLSGNVSNLVLASPQISGGGEKIGALAGKANGAVILKVGVENGNITGEKQIGGLVGFSTDNSDFLGCYNMNTIIEGTVNSNQCKLGGIVGDANGGRIYSCFSTGEIETQSSGGFGAISGTTIFGGGSNVYLDALGISDNSNSIAMTQEQFENGEAAHYLNQNPPTGLSSLEWKQRLSGDDKNLLPVWSGDANDVVVKITFKDKNLITSILDEKFINKDALLSDYPEPTVGYYNFYEVTGEWVNPIEKTYSADTDIYVDTNANKTVVTISTSDVLVYNGTEQTLTLISSDSAFTPSSSNVALKVTLKTDGSDSTLLQAGDYIINYEVFNESFSGFGIFDISISKATPVITTIPTASRIIRGSKLEESALTGGVASVDGTFDWETPTEEMTTVENATRKVIFTPTDTTNYTTAECDVTVNVYRRSSSSSLGESTRYTVKFDTDEGSTIKSVTVNRNGKVTEPTEPIKDGYVFDGWYTDKDFTEKYDFESKVTKSFTLYAKWVELEPQPTEWQNPFIDVNKEDWFYEVVKYNYENGLMIGVSQNQFAPNMSITRGMFVTILYRLEGEPQVNRSKPFADVNADDYFANAVIWADQNEIVKGISETEFAPNANITREQMATILYRYAKAKGYDVSVGESTNILSYTDFDKISEYAIEALQYTCGAGLIKGRTESTLNPQDFATRAETAAILQRFIEGNIK